VHFRFTARWIWFNRGEDIHTRMNTKHKMAIAGAGLVAAGIGLGIIGTGLIAPVLAWAAKLLDKGSERLGSELESASRRVGSAAGTLQRSFNEAEERGRLITNDSPAERKVHMESRPLDQTAWVSV